MDFFLNYLLIVEQNASQFHSNDKEKAYFGTQRFLEMSEVDDGGERNEAGPKRLIMYLFPPFRPKSRGIMRIHRKNIIVLIVARLCGLFPW